MLERRAVPRHGLGQHPRGQQLAARLDGAVKLHVLREELLVGHARADAAVDRLVLVVAEKLGNARDLVFAHLEARTLEGGSKPAAQMTEAEKTELIAQRLMGELLAEDCQRLGNAALLEGRTADARVAFQAAAAVAPMIVNRFNGMFTVRALTPSPSTTSTRKSSITG